MSTQGACSTVAGHLPALSLLLCAPCESPTKWPWKQPGGIQPTTLHTALQSLPPQLGWTHRPLSRSMAITLVYQLLTLSCLPVSRLSLSSGLPETLL